MHLCEVRKEFWSIGDTLPMNVTLQLVCEYSPEMDPVLHTTLISGSMIVSTQMYGRIEYDPWRYVSGLWF